MTKLSTASLFPRLLSTDSAIFLIIVSGFVLRFANLDADPFPRIWIGYITDEGFWNYNARNTLLFGQPFFDFSNLHFFIAPIFQSINYLIFLALDISYTSARIFPALCGSFLVLLYFVFFKNVLSRESILLGIIFLSFQPELLMLSRVSIPEAPLMLVELLLFYLIIRPNRSPLTYFLFALVLFFGIGIKATFIPLASILICTLFGTPGHGCYTILSSYRNRKTILCLFGIGTLFLLVVIGSIRYLENNPIIGHPVAVILHYLRINSVFSVVSFPFYDSTAPTFNFLALGVWLSLIAWWHLDKTTQRGFRLHQLFVPAALWFGLYLILMNGLGYFPERYKVHIFLPMVIMISIGASILKELDTGKIWRSLSEPISFALFCKIAFYILPSSILIAVLIKYGIQSVFGVADRFLIRLLCIGMAFALVFVWSVKFRYQKSLVVFLFLFPFLTSASWFFGYHLQDSFPFWIPMHSDPYSKIWIALLVGILSLSILCYVFFEKLIWPTPTTVCNAFSAVLLATLLAWITPLYSNPCYTIRETSKDLGAILQGSKGVGILNSYGLFLENDIQYLSEIHSKARGFYYPQYIISIFNGAHVNKFRKYLDKYYKETRSYYLDIYPYPELDSSNVKVSVYKKI